MEGPHWSHCPLLLRAQGGQLSLSPQLPPSSLMGVDVSVLLRPGLGGHCPLLITSRTPSSSPTSSLPPPDPTAALSPPEPHMASPHSAAGEVPWPPCQLPQTPGQGASLPPRPVSAPRSNITITPPDGEPSPTAPSRNPSSCAQQDHPDPGSALRWAHRGPGASVHLRPQVKTGPHLPTGKQRSLWTGRPRLPNVKPASWGSSAALSPRHHSASCLCLTSRSLLCLTCPLGTG